MVRQARAARIRKPVADPSSGATTLTTMTGILSGTADPTGTGSGPSGDGVRWHLVRPVLLANLVAEVLIVVTGGLVRLTGSGLGCPTWPECVDGSITPVARQAEGIHKYIEFGNRTLTGVLGLLAVATLVAVWHVARRRATGADGGRGLLVLGAAPLVMVLVQAVLGGITVLTSLHPATVAEHFLLSMVTIALCTWLVLVVVPEPVRARQAPAGPVLAVVVATAAVLALGTIVTGTGPHSGDLEAPARFDLDPLLVSRVHSAAAWAMLAATALTWVRRPALRPALRWVLAVVLAQGIVGYVQYATGLPEPLVAVHMLLAALLVCAVTLLVERDTASVRRPVEAVRVGR